MSAPVVHFEIEGLNAAALRDFYAQLFGWEVDLDLNNPAQYGMIRGATADRGIGGAISQVPNTPSTTWQGPTREQGYSGHVTVFMAVDDVETALTRAVELGGSRLQGPDPLYPGVEIGKLADPEGHLIGVITAGKEG